VGVIRGTPVAGPGGSRIESQAGMTAQQRIGIR